MKWNCFSTLLTLSNARSCRGVVFREAPEDLPGTKDPVAACLLGMRLTVARVKPTRAAIAPCLMPSRASANTSCLIPIGVGRGIVRTIRKTFQKICKYWFKVVTVWRLIWGNDHLYCGFGARRSHLTLHWMSAQGSVGFLWGTITGPYHANFSQVETQKFDPHWFYCIQWVWQPFLPRVYMTVKFTGSNMSHLRFYTLPASIDNLMVYFANVYT